MYAQPRSLLIHRTLRGLHETHCLPWLGGEVQDGPVVSSLLEQRAVRVVHMLAVLAKG